MKNVKLKQSLSTELYNKINSKISYQHNDNLDSLEGRNQFNFTAGNFS